MLPEIVHVDVDDNDPVALSATGPDGAACSSPECGQGGSARQKPINHHHTKTRNNPKKPLFHQG